jgi:DnaJ-class molecular chaperone
MTTTPSMTDLKQLLERLRNPCGNCDGTGTIDFRDHSHRCDKCGGSGVARTALHAEGLE